MRSAREIAEHLGQFIIGQDQAVRSLAVAAAQHYARIAYTGEVPTRKANVVLIGPTGVGKTQMVRSLSEVLEVPFAQVSAAALTQPGFTGLDPDFVLADLLRRAQSPALAERGIAYIDEIDKIARKDTDDGDKSKNLTTGLGVQHSLLDVLDARTWTFADGSTMDASGVLFILSGAFVGIERLVALRKRASQRVAAPIVISQAEALREIEPVDLINYGLIPELVGRIPVIVPLRMLDAHEILRILTEPLDAPVKRLAAEFEAIGAVLQVCEGFLYAVANEAIQKKTGARALEGVLRTALRDAYFEAQAGDVISVGPEGEVTKENRPPASPIHR